MFSILEIFFCEVENTARKKASVNPNDAAPLTPNLLLIMKQGQCLPPGRCNADADGVMFNMWLTCSDDIGYICTCMNFKSESNGITQCAIL